MVAEECGLEKSTVSDVKQAAKFCDEHSDLSDCSTRAIMALIRIRDDSVREKAISSIEKSFESGKHPLTGQVLKKKALTEREIKAVIERADLEVRKELMKDAPPAGKKTFPPLCSRCIHREGVDQFGDPYYCGLMVEAKREGVPIWSCSHFKKEVPA